MPKVQDIGVLRTLITADSTQFKKELDKAAKALRGPFGKMKKLGKSMSKVGKTLSTRVTLPILAMGAVIARTAGKFEASMNHVQTLTRASGEEFDKLKRKARDLGRDTQFTASEAADGMGLLAQAGLNTNEIMAAIPNSLNLAAAANIDLAEATDRSLKVMSGYGKGVGDLAHINDVLARGSSAVNTTITDLTEAFFKAGPIAKTAGIQFEQTAAVLATLQNAGFQGAEAGTALKAIIGGILNPSQKVSDKMKELGINLTDAAGKMKAFPEILKELKPVADDTGFLLEAFGKRGGPAMAALLQVGIDKLGDLEGKLKNSTGEAARIAEGRMKGLNGSIKRMNSAFQELQLTLADTGILKTLTGLVDKISGLLKEVSDTNPELLKMGVQLLAVTAAAGPVLLVVGKLIGVVATVGGGLATAGAAILAFLGGPLTLLVAAFIGGTAAIVTYRKEIKVFTDAIYLKMNAAIASVHKNLKLFGDSTFVSDFFDGMLADIDGAVAALVKFTDGIKAALYDKMKKFAGFAVTAFESVTSAAASMYDKVVGHSYVPDMVDQIGSEFSKLASNMVSPAEQATDEVGNLFDRMGSKVASVLKDVAENMKKTFVSNLMSKLIGGLFSGGSKASVPTDDRSVTAGDVLGYNENAAGGILKRAAVVAPGQIAGEKGPEGMLPLSNVAGKLGVSASGMASTINFYDQRTAPTSAPIQAKTSSDGLSIDVIIGDITNANFANGVHSQALQQLGINTNEGGIRR